MPLASDHYAQSAESLVVRLARRGDSRALEELVRRRQSWIRNLMRRLSGDAALADDLAQQVFLQLWHRIGQLREPERFAGWLKRMAVNIWLQHARAKDALDLSDASTRPRTRRIAQPAWPSTSIARSRRWPLRCAFASFSRIMSA